MYWWYALYWALFWGGLGVLIGRGKRRSTEGALLGALLGPLGLVGVALLSPAEATPQFDRYDFIPDGDEPQCPHCGAIVQPNASFCEACGGALGDPSPKEAEPSKDAATRSQELAERLKRLE